MAVELVPASAVVPTCNRSAVLARMLQSLVGQSVQPIEIIIVDASNDQATLILCEQGISGLQSQIRWFPADVRGAASQRNQGLTAAKQSTIWFLDDDIRFEPHCPERLWKALKSDPRLGGVNAMITNQNYGTPGKASRFMFRLMNGKFESSYAGRVIGPAINLLPDDRDDLPEVVRVDWLNTTCTMYRREALPDPPFSGQFTGYSLMEDLALSLEVGKRWKLVNARTARIFHDSEAADYKSDARTRSCMELINRIFVMTRIIGRDRFGDYCKLVLWELFSLASAAASREGRKSLLYILRGKWDGLRQIVSEAGGARNMEKGAKS